MICGFRQRRMAFRTKVALVMGLAMAAATSLSSYAIYRLAMKEAVAELGERLKAIAISGALGIDGDKVELIRSPVEMNSPEYQNLKAYLQKLRDRNKDLRLRFVYTMAPAGKPGFWRYGVDAEPQESQDFSPPGKTEDFTYDTTMRFALEQPVADSELRIYRGWGKLLSASAPIKNHDHLPVGVLSIDASPDAITEALMGLRRWSIVFAALSILLSVALSYPLARHITRPIGALIHGTRVITSGDYNHQVEIPNNDEIGDLAAAFNVMTEGLRERALFKSQFERYVSPQVARKILSHPEQTFWRAERRKATILFCDIRGFTAFAERMPPEEVVERLNHFFSRMIDIVFLYEGTLDKFMGDALMALFGVPWSSGNDEERAIYAAVAMQQEAARMIQEGPEPFRIGIGINTGDVVVGNIGSERRMEYSAIGDAVNIAARIEGLNRERQTGILISESTYQAVRPLVQVRQLGAEVLRGRQEPVPIYEVVGLTPEARPLPLANA